MAVKFEGVRNRPIIDRPPSLASVTYVKTLLLWCLPDITELAPLVAT